MDFELTDRAKELRESLLAFMDECIYPDEPVPPSRSRARARHTSTRRSWRSSRRRQSRRGLWNLFLPDDEHGAGLTNCDYAPLAEIMGRTQIASEACNCSAPDTGNMEVLHQFGTDEQKQRWLQPLLDGEIRSAFAMTEPDVASSDATNIALRIERDGDDYVLNGRKWWTTNALHPNLRILIVMGKTDPGRGRPTGSSRWSSCPRHARCRRCCATSPCSGTTTTRATARSEFNNVRVPAENIIAGEGMGFMIAQARLGPGRIHHCMRAIGAAERALELMCARADEREAFGNPVSHYANIRDWIAESRIEIEMARLLVMKTAWLMDTVGNQHARIEISGIKFAVPEICLRIVDRAIQVHGGGGVSDDFPLAEMYACLRTLRLADGPDEVHKLSLARQELGRQRERREAARAPAR